MSAPHYMYHEPTFTTFPPSPFVQGCTRRKKASCTDEELRKGYKKEEKKDDHKKAEDRGEVGFISTSIYRDTISESQPSMAQSPHDSNPYSISIEPKLLELLVHGTKDDLISLGINFSEFKSPKDDNSILHLAATYSSQSQLISDILPSSKDVIKWKNCMGDLAFHLAAKARQLDCLKALTKWQKYDSGVSEIDEKLLGVKNSEGDTALHIALENHQFEMAKYLVDEYGVACYILNEKKKTTPIYLAIKAKYWDIVKRMIEIAKNQRAEAVNAMLKGKSVVHLAIEGHNLDILKEILESFEELISLYDEDGKTPLSYAAFKGYLKEVERLIDMFPESAYMRNNNQDECFPIHQAASGGHITVIQKLRCTKHFLNNKGQSILHVAALNGKSKAVSYLLGVQELETLINMKDEYGNTPLHLAAFRFHPRVVYILTGNKKVHPESENKDGLTALDLAEIFAGSNPSFEARLTWMALKQIDAPRSSPSSKRSYMRKLLSQDKKTTWEIRKHYEPPSYKELLESYKARVDTNLLVATLVATVTFAAGFTLPGGYKQDGPHIGMVVLPHKLAFKAFVICNTAAMYSSVLAIVTLLWAHILDLKLIILSLRFATKLLGLALVMMSFAFMMGIYVVLMDLPWLSYVVLGLGFVFLVAVLMVFLPLHHPSYISNRVVRSFFSGTFLLLLLVCEKSQIVCF